MIETEITAEINKESFDRYIQSLTTEFGEPKKVRRIAFMVIESGADLDTRIKITNGKPELVQKLKISVDEHGKRIKKECIIDLSRDVEQIKKAIELLDNFYEANKIKPRRLIIQHENYLWNTTEVEIKLTKQFGKSDYFVYEIEALKDDASLEAIEESLGLKADADLNSEERRNHRAFNVDLSMDEMSEEEIESLIRNYLN